MSQFIYSFTGKQRPAPIVWETISYKLTGANGTVWWTDQPDAKKVDWMPLTSSEGVLTGATYLQVRIDGLASDYAMLEVHPAKDGFDRALGDLAAHGSRANHAEAACVAAVFQR